MAGARGEHEAGSDAEKLAVTGRERHGEPAE
jgi:hypothetical protein